MTRFFSVVPKDVGRNPIARAVAIAAMTKQMRTFQLSLYMMEDGSEQAQALIAASWMLAVAVEIRRLQGLTTGVAVMRGAHSAVMGRAKHGFIWRAADAVAIDMGMVEAMAAVRSATPTQVQAAWMAVRQQEEEACAASAATSP